MEHIETAVSGASSVSLEMCSICRNHFRDSRAMLHDVAKLPKANQSRISHTTSVVWPAQTKIVSECVSGGTWFEYTRAIAAHINQGASHTVASRWVNQPTYVHATALFRYARAGAPGEMQCMAPGFQLCSCRSLREHAARSNYDWGKAGASLILCKFVINLTIYSIFAQAAEWALCWRSRFSLRTDAPSQRARENI